MLRGSQALKRWTTKIQNIIFSAVLVFAQMSPMAAFFTLNSGIASAAGTITFGAQFENQTFPNDPNTWTNGNLDNYSEGDYVNFRFSINASDATGAGTMLIEYDLSSCNFFTNYFNVASVSPSIATVDEGSQALIDPNGNNNSYYRQNLNVSFNTAGTATVIFTLQLSNTAGECSGSNTGVRLGVPEIGAGDFANAGAKTLPMAANQVLENPSITITKTVIGGNAEADDFTFTLTPAINGQSLYTFPTGEDSLTINEVNPDGVYTIIESQLPGYVFTGGTGTNCVATNQSGVMTATVTADPDDPVDAVCNFTNQFQTGNIIIEKQTLPDGDTTDFTFNPSWSDNNFQLSDGETKDSGSLVPSTYSVAETVPSGWDLTNTVCTSNQDDDQSTIQNISLQANETITCVFTNTKRATITVQKTTLPSLDQTLFGIEAFVDGQTGEIFGSATANVSDATDHTYEVAPGTYDITETVPSGWAKTGDTCQNVTVQAGEDVSCLLTNTKLASISGFKYEVNSDGSEPTILSNWTINLMLNGLIISTDFTDDNGAYSFEGLLPDEYEVEEVQQTGWTQISNVDGCQENYMINLQAGQTSENNDFCNFQNGTIKGYKWNDMNGDGLVANEPKLEGWTIFIDENDNQELDQGELSDITDVNGNYEFTDLAPGEYTVCEVQQTGWTQTAPGTQTGCSTRTIDDSGEEITLNFGNQGRGSIKVVKHVDNNNDGDYDDDGDEENATDWVWNIDGSGDYATGSSQSVAAGDYTVSEEQKSGYYATFVSCTGEGALDDSTSAYVSVSPGENVVCTFINSKELGTLKVKKAVVNDDGGDAKASDFSFYFENDEEADYNFINKEQDNESGYYKFSLAPGEYSVFENDFPGYELTSSTCEDVQVTLNQTATCEFVNDDIAPQLTLKKTVINNDGGDLDADDFGIAISGASPVVFGPPVSTNGDSKTYESSGFYNANVEMTISEDDTDGYEEGTWICDNGINGTGLEVKVTLNEGDNVTCEITNDDIAPTLTLRKHLVLDNGGDASADDWYLKAIDENYYSPIYKPGDLLETCPENIDSCAETESTEVKANTYYTLNEYYGPVGYEDSYWVCEGGSQQANVVVLGLDEDVVCTITNDDLPAFIYVDKEVINDNGGQLDSSDFQITLNGENIPQGELVEIDVNETYTVDELSVAGYEMTNIFYEEFPFFSEEFESEALASYSRYCYPRENGLSSLQEVRLIPVIDMPIFDIYESDTFESSPCKIYRFTVVNDDQPAEITVNKVVINDNGSNLTPDNFTLFVNEDEVTSGQTIEYEANQPYTISEEALAGYKLVSIECVDADTGEELANPVTPTNGQSVTCTVTNDDDPKITVVLPETSSSTFTSNMIGVLMIGLALGLHRKEILSVVSKRGKN